METTTLTEIAKQVPSLAVLAGVVWLFLKAGQSVLESNTATHKDLQANYLLSLRDIQVENIEARSQSRAAIQENTVATREMNRTLVDLLMETKKVR